MSVTGILETNKNGAQLLPRSAADIEDRGPSDDILKRERPLSTPSARYPYASATLGGVVALAVAWVLRAKGITLAQLFRK